MTKLSSFLRCFLPSLALALLLGAGGCSPIPEQPSWYHHKGGTQNPPAPPSSTITPAEQDAASPRVLPPPEATARVLPPPRPSGKAKVAILLPLTGKNAALGQAMLNAAQMAVFDAADKRFELMPRDTGDNDANAARAAQDAINGGAELLIGPVFAAGVTAADPVAQAADINMLALSTDTTLADTNVFVMGFAPVPQVDRVISYARTRGAHNFAALIPSTPYGGLVREAFEAAVGRNGGTLSAIEEYDPSGGAASAISLLGARSDMVDALFLPAGTPDIDSMSDQLQANGFAGTRIHLLGTGLWDVSDLARHAPATVGGWYAAPDPRARQNFANAYARTYGSEPPRLATLAYDATALAATLAKRGAAYDLDGLTNPNGFAGLDGIFRLTPQGLTERGLAILEVTETGARTLDPAPASFARRPR